MQSEIDQDPRFTSTVLGPYVTFVRLLHLASRKIDSRAWKVCQDTIPGRLTLALDRNRIVSLQTTTVHHPFHPFPVLCLPFSVTCGTVYSGTHTYWLHYPTIIKGRIPAWGMLH
jgi:hypothetical protein